MEELCEQAKTPLAFWLFLYIIVVYKAVLRRQTCQNGR